MSELSVLSVGYVYDYPLLGGEKFHDLIPTFNKQFGLTLTKDNFINNSATRKDDGLIGIIAVSNKDAKIYQFINQTSKGVLTATSIDFSKSMANVVRCKPVMFEKEMAFLEDLPLNTSITFSTETAQVLYMLSLLLTDYSNQTFDSTGENGVAGCIIRYYGTGESVPEEYGSYTDSSAVCIVDIPKTSGYKSYCIRTELDYVDGIGH